MCGGFAMLSLKSPSSIENSANQRFFSAGLWAYLLAKATSYGVLGVALGFVGSSFHATPLGMRILAIVVGTILIITGLQIGGFSPFARFQTGRNARESGPASNLSKLRRFPFWLASRMSAAVASVGTGNRFLLGLMNGFLPCGLLYAALAYSTSLASPTTSGLFMVVFGLGTFPALILAANFMTWLRQSLASVVVKMTGILIVLTGIITLMRGLQVLNPMMH